MIALYLYLACAVLLMVKIAWTQRKGIKTWLPQWTAAAMMVGVGLAWPLAIALKVWAWHLEHNGGLGKFVDDVAREGTDDELRMALSNVAQPCPTCNGNNVLTGVVRELVHIECDDGAKHEVKSKARFYCDDCKVAYGREP
jgi:hypothetical protein